jgi:hypothetical protein
VGYPVCVIWTLGIWGFGIAWYITLVTIPYSSITRAGIETASISYNITSHFAAPRGLPALTTAFTYASSCIENYLQFYPEATSILYSSYCYDAEGPGQNFGNNYLTCQAGKTEPTYSPGICPSGYTIATVTEWQSTPGATESRLRKAACCSRHKHPSFLH